VELSLARHRRSLASTDVFAGLSTSLISRRYRPTVDNSGRAAAADSNCYNDDDAIQKYAKWTDGRTRGSVRVGTAGAAAAAAAATEQVALVAGCVQLL